MKVILQPQDVYPLTPNKDVSQHITHVTPRSPVEIWLNGLQSVGEWKGFLGYTLGASIVVWIGLLTNTIYLLVAAMLIAPFAGPAMNLARDCIYHWWPVYGGSLDQLHGLTWAYIIR